MCSAWLLTRDTDSQRSLSPTDWDIVFADDERESNPTSFKFLQMAHAWKAAQAKNGSGTSSALSGFVAASNASANSSGAGPTSSSGGDGGKSEPGDAREDRADDGSSDVASSNGGDD